MIKTGNNYIYIIEDLSYEYSLCAFDISMNKQQQQTVQGLYLSNDVDQNDRLIQISKQLNILVYNSKQFMNAKQVSDQMISQVPIPQITSDNEYVYTLFIIKQNQKYQLIIDQQKSDLQQYQTQQLTLTETTLRIQEMKIISVGEYLLIVYYQKSEYDCVLSYIVYSKPYRQLMKQSHTINTQLINQIQLQQTDNQHVLVLVLYQQQNQRKLISQYFSLSELRILEQFNTFNNINVSSLKLVYLFKNVMVVVNDTNNTIYKQQIIISNSDQQSSSLNLVGISIVCIAVFILILGVVIVSIKKHKINKKARKRSAFNVKRGQTRQRRPMTSGMKKKTLQQNDIEELKNFRNYDIQKKLDQMSQANNLTFLERKEQQAIETQNFIQNESANYDEEFVNQIENEIEMEIEIKNQKIVIDQDWSQDSQNKDQFIIINNQNDKSEQQINDQSHLQVDDPSYLQIEIDQNHNDKLKSEIKYENIQKQESENINSEYQLESDIYEGGQQNIYEDGQQMNKKILSDEDQEMMEGLSEFGQNHDIQNKQDDIYEIEKQESYESENIVESSEQSYKSVKINNENIESIIQISQVLK